MSLSQYQKENKLRNNKEILSKLKEELNQREKLFLSNKATFSLDAIREKKEEYKYDHRQPFAIDTDRILHSLAYTRYIDKTQVFSLIPNDHITHRVLHVQLVSKIARTIGRFLRLNEDLIEAISLGHDIGHPPFGHDGERFLNALCQKAGIGPFLHSVQGVRFLRYVEKKGKGCNLTLQVLDGILCHDGESDLTILKPQKRGSFSDLDKAIEQKLHFPNTHILPMTLEGCVVRLADIISYIGRDIEDAIRLRLIKREDIPLECREVLGDTNGKIVYRLVEDLIITSIENNFIGFSEEVASALLKLKNFNMEYIYLNPKIKTQAPKIKKLFEILFETFLDDLERKNTNSVIFTNFLNGMDEKYLELVDKNPALVVTDFIAGMTDAYFLRIASNILLPQPLPERF